MQGQFYQVEATPTREVFPGFTARMLHSAHMTFAFWQIAAGSMLPEHHHPHEQVAILLEGRFELTVDGETSVLVPGTVAVMKWQGVTARDKPGKSTPKARARLRADGSLSLPPLSVKRILMAMAMAFGCLAFCLARTQAQEGQYWGTIIRNPPASYVLQMDDGKLLDAEWTSGEEDWSIGDRVMLTTESGGGFMFNGERRTQVDVFSYDPSETGDEEE
jgi:hypothetical protein